MISALHPFPDESSCRSTSFTPTPKVGRNSDSNRWRTVGEPAVDPVRMLPGPNLSAVQDKSYPVCNFGAADLTRPSWLSP